MGAGSKPEIGAQAAKESIDSIIRCLEGVNMAFMTAGMGGGTGNYSINWLFNCTV